MEKETERPPPNSLVQYAVLSVPPTLCVAPISCADDESHAKQAQQDTLLTDETRSPIAKSGEPRRRRRCLLYFSKPFSSQFAVLF